MGRDVVRRWLGIIGVLIVTVPLVLQVQAEPTTSTSTTPTTPNPVAPSPATPAEATPIVPKVVATTLRTSIAIVNVNVLMSRAPQAAAAKENLERKYAPIEAQLNKERQTLNELQTQLPQLPEDQRIQKERDLRSKERTYERAAEDFRAEIRIARDEALSEVQKQVLEAINTIREKGNIDIVLKESDYISANPQIDITNKVLDYLQYQFNHSSSTVPNQLNNVPKVP